jgi:hypothetical protein
MPTLPIENAHSGYAGKSLVNFIQESLDKAYQEFDDASGTDAIRLQGYVAGLAKALGIIRGTSVQSELEESRRRLAESHVNNQQLIEGVR